jgi:hypothetical protein
MQAFEVLQSHSARINTAWVITDERAYAVSILKKLSKVYPEIQFDLAPTQNSDWLQDFVLLRHARSRIIGNSSFSWWAAALDPARAITVTPSSWINGVPRDLFLPWEMSIIID